jgi:hypothetical protein
MVMMMMMMSGLASLLGMPDRCSVIVQLVVV